MKRIPLLLCALILFANAYAGDVKLHGKILHHDFDSISVSYNDNRIAYLPNEHAVKLRKNGSFDFTLQVPDGIYTQAQIKYGSKTADLVLQPGDDIALTTNAAHFDTLLHYEGSGSTIQNFIAKHAIEREPMNALAVRVKPLMAKDSISFQKSMHGELDDEFKFLENNKTGLPAAFIIYWKAFYQYTAYYYMLQYPLIHEMVTEKRSNIDSISRESYLVARAVPYSFNDSLIDVAPYLLYVTNIFYENLKANNYTFKYDDTLGAQKTEDTVTKLANALLPDKTAEYFFAQDLYGKAKRQRIEKTRQQLNAFKKRWPNSAYLPTLEKQVGLAARFAPGMPAPDFDITTADGQRMKLSDLKGKVVYLSFWADWCRQCFGEIISEKKMKSLLKDKPVAFVYVSIDDDAVKDTLLMSRYKITGIKTHASGGWYAKEVALYGVQELPAYFLIDEEGNFASQNAPTPRQETELILEIEKLFK